MAVEGEGDGRQIASDEDLISAIRSARPGQEVELTFYDTGDRLTKKLVRLGESGGSSSGSSPSSLPGAGTFGSGSNSFGSTAPGTSPPPTDSLPRPGLGGSSRPLLNRIERAAERIGSGAGLGGAGGLVVPSGPTGPTTVYDPAAMAALQRSVQELTTAVNALDARLRQLEGRSGGGNDAGSSSPPSTPGFGSPAPSVIPGFGTPTTP